MRKKWFWWQLRIINRIIGVNLIFNSFNHLFSTGFCYAIEKARVGWHRGIENCRQPNASSVFRSNTKTNVSGSLCSGPSIPTSNTWAMGFVNLFFFLKFIIVYITKNNYWKSEAYQPPPICYFFFLPKITHLVIEICFSSFSFQLHYSFIYFVVFITSLLLLLFVVLVQNKCLNLFCGLINCSLALLLLLFLVFGFLFLICCTWAMAAGKSICYQICWYPGTPNSNDSYKLTQMSNEWLRDERGNHNVIVENKK